MNIKVYFSETKSSVFERNNFFHLKHYFVLPTEYRAVNNFCWNVRDEMTILYENITEKQNLSIKEKRASTRRKNMH